MVSLAFIFWLFVLLFAVIGAMRGWAREILVSASVILALFVLTVLERYIPPVRDFFQPPNGTAEFWARTMLVVIMVFFGYQTPNLARFAGARFARERLSDTLLGFFLGALNGYLIVGTIWYFLDQSGYPFPRWIIPPDPNNPMTAAASEIMPYLPPRWLGIPTIYFAIALAFIFVLVVFI
jgi:uncharacterized membrane protein required for colicin V production